MSSKYTQTIENTSVETKLVYIKPINFLKKKRKCSENEISLSSHNNCAKLSSISSSFIDKGFNDAQPIFSKLKMSKIKSEECNICLNEITYAYKEDILKCNCCKVKCHYNCLDTLNKIRYQKKMLFKSSENFTCDLCSSLKVINIDLCPSDVSQKKTTTCAFCKKQSKGLFLFNDYLAHIYCYYIVNNSKNNYLNDHNKECSICNKTNENQFIISISCKIKSCQSLIHLNCWLDSNHDKIQLLLQNIFNNLSLDCILHCKNHKFNEKETNCKYII